VPDQESGKKATTYPLPERVVELLTTGAPEKNSLAKSLLAHERPEASQIVQVDMDRLVTTLLEAHAQYLDVPMS
jgi:hypothetical protein